MGTRNFTSVILNGEQIVCQYCQWDGYPTYTGVKILEFLRDCDVNKFKQALGNTYLTKTPWEDAKTYVGSTKNIFEIYDRVSDKQRKLNEANRLQDPSASYIGSTETSLLMLSSGELSRTEVDDFLTSSRDIGADILKYIYERDISLPPLELFTIKEEEVEVADFAKRECASEAPGCDAQGYFVIDLDKNKVFMNFDDVAWQCDISSLPEDIERTMALYEFDSNIPYMDTPKTPDDCIAELKEFVKNVGYDDSFTLTAEEKEIFLAKCYEKWPDVASNKNEVQFRAGYYEWNVIVNNEHVYTFDGSNTFEKLSGLNAEELNYYVENLIDLMQEERPKNGKLPLRAEIVGELKKQMTDTWKYYVKTPELTAKTWQPKGKNLRNANNDIDLDR